MTEWQNDRTTEIPEGQGKSNIAPTFSKQGYNDNSVDPDQTAPSCCLHWMLRPVL